MPNAPDAESRRDSGASPLWSPAPPDGATPSQEPLPDLPDLVREVNALRAAVWDAMTPVGHALADTLRAIERPEAVRYFWALRDHAFGQMEESLFGLGHQDLWPARAGGRDTATMDGATMAATPSEFFARPTTPMVQSWWRYQRDHWDLHAANAWHHAAGLLASTAADAYPSHPAAFATLTAALAPAVTWGPGLPGAVVGATPAHHNLDRNGLPLGAPVRILVPSVSWQGTCVYPAIIEPVAVAPDAPQWRVSAVPHDPDRAFAWFGSSRPQGQVVIWGFPPEWSGPDAVAQGQRHLADEGLPSISAPCAPAALVAFHQARAEQAALAPPRRGRHL